MDSAAVTEPSDSSTSAPFSSPNSDPTEPESLWAKAMCALRNPTLLAAVAIVGVAVIVIVRSSKK